jgi:hypothetical protein
LAICVLIAHSIPDSASWRARAPSDRFCEIWGSTEPSDMKVMVSNAKTIRRIIARGKATPRSLRSALTHPFIAASSVTPVIGSGPRLDAPDRVVRMEHSKTGATGSGEAFRDSRAGPPDRRRLSRTAFRHAHGHSSSGFEISLKIREASRPAPSPPGFFRHS